ncbi:unnamed protein product [Brachionus calyciflorus]|uniref:Uncharacterized protein n=1 Tax=Brachionus calyciflorus TaxID=104777 RepID=A0A813M2G8_9BILA|nr:unnamed protein product [Brachionus calyciflorus]
MYPDLKIFKVDKNVNNEYQELYYNYVKHKSFKFPIKTDPEFYVKLKTLAILASKQKGSSHLSVLSHVNEAHHECYLCNNIPKQALMVDILDRNECFGLSFYYRLAYIQKKSLHDVYINLNNLRKASPIKNLPFEKLLFNPKSSLDAYEQEQRVRKIDNLKMNMLKQLSVVIVKLDKSFIKLNEKHKNSQINENSAENFKTVNVDDAFSSNITNLEKHDGNNVNSPLENCPPNDDLLTEKTNEETCKHDNIMSRTVNLDTNIHSKDSPDLLTIDLSNNNNNETKITEDIFDWEKDTTLSNLTLKRKNITSDIECFLKHHRIAVESAEVLPTTSRAVLEDFEESDAEIVEIQADHE